MAPMGQATKDKIDKALIAKEEGNKAFKAGNTKAAINHYYQVIFLLKGLTGFAPFPTSSLARTTGPKIQEVEANDTSITASDGDDDADSSDDDDDEEEDEADDEKNAEYYTFESIQKVQAQCYVNMAICHAKNSAWDKCKRNAEEALKLDPKNEKALFKQAQATVRLGEATKGRKLLIELSKTTKDPAVANELKILNQAEAASAEKSKASMRGFINKANPLVPKFEEIKEDKPIKQEEAPAVLTSASEQPNGQTTSMTTPSASPDKGASSAMTNGVDAVLQKAANGQVELPPTPPKLD